MYIRKCARFYLFFNKNVGPTKRLLHNVGSMCLLTENVNDNTQTTNCADDVTERETLIALDSGLSTLLSIYCIF